MTKKKQKTRWCNAPGKHCFESALLGAFVSQSIDFWSILGPKGDQIGLQNRYFNDKIGFWFHLGAPGCAREQFWVDFGSILEVFWGLWGAFWHHFGATEVAKSASCNASQKTAANSSKRHKKAANSTKTHQIIENRYERQQIPKA